MSSRIVKLLLAISLTLALVAVVPAATISKTNNTDNLNLGSSWVGGIAPGSSDIAQWAGTVANTNTVSLGTNLSWAGIQLTTPGGPVTINAGNTLALGAAGIDLATATQNLTLNGALNLSSNQSWSIALNRTLLVGGAVSGAALLTVPGPGAVTLGGGSYSFGTAAAGNNALALNGGTLNVQSGTLTLNGNNNSTDGAHINGNTFFNQSGGTVNSSFYTRLGSGGAGTVSTLNVTGGTFYNNGEILFGFGGSGSGTLTLSGSGLVDSHFLRLGDTSAAGTHTVNLDGGMIKTDRIFRSNGTAVFNFNGGLLQVNNNPSSPWFAASVSNVWVRSGGAFIDTNGKDVTLQSGIKPFSGSTGGLNKLGAGTLTLTGTNTYSGPTIVSNGTLAISGSLSNNATLTVTDGATLIVASPSVKLGGLVLSPSSRLQLNLGAPANPSNAAIQVNGPLTLDGTVLLNDLGGLSTGAVYTVINYTGALTNNGLVEDPQSGWQLTVDTATPQQVKITAVRRYDFIEIQEGDLVVNSLYTNLTATIHGTAQSIMWYEVRSNSPTGTLLDFGAHAQSSPWPFTVRHLREGTNLVTVFARDTGGITRSNSARLVLNLPANTPVRPRPIPAEIWWGGLSTNQQLLDPTKPWDFVKQHQDGLFFHSAGYGGLTSSDKTDLATMLRPYNTRYCVELGGGTDNPGDAWVQFQAVTGWGAHLTAQQNLGLVMSQITHDYHMENMEDVCRAHPDWTTNNLIAWWTGDMSITNGNYPFTSGLWRDVFLIYYTNNPHLKVGHTSSSVYWPWAGYPYLAGAWNNLLYNPLREGGNVPNNSASNAVVVSGTNVSFSFNGRDILLGFVRMAQSIGRPQFTFYTDFPWNYYGTWGNQASATTNRAKIRFYERELQTNGARHTLICNVGNAGSQPGGNDAQDVYYKTSSLNTLFLHQQEGGRANCYLFESWYGGIPHTAAPESKNGSYANLALDAIKYLKGIRTNGSLQTLSLTLSSSGVTNLIQLTNNGDSLCLPAVIALEGAGGSNAVTYLNASNQDITAAMLSVEGYVHTNRLNPGQGTQIKVVAPAGLDRLVTLEAFWNPQDPTGVVRDRLVLTPPNRPPTLAAVSNQTMIAGQTLVITNVATDPDVPSQTLTFSLVTSPAGAGINPSNRVFTWRPTIAQSPSTNLISVKVTDSGVPPLSATQSFSVFVQRPAQPTLSAPAISNGVFSLTVSGEAGPDYGLFVSTNLATTNWLLLQQSNPPVLPFRFVDSAATNFDRRFYRIQLLP